MPASCGATGHAEVLGESNVGVRAARPTRSERTQLPAPHKVIGQLRFEPDRAATREDIDGLVDLDAVEVHLDPVALRDDHELIPLAGRSLDLVWTAIPELVLPVAVPAQRVHRLRGFGQPQRFAVGIPDVSTAAIPGVVPA